MKQITVYNDYDSKFLYNSESISNLVLYIFKDKKVKLNALSIILTDSISLSKLKKKYFNVNQFTDVIAFNLNNENDCIEGEIYISIDDVKENAKIYSESFENEFKRVIIHGSLHLMGFDDSTEDEKKTMTDLENIFINKFKKLIII